ncbi:hypothetical protein, partial [Bacteroides thetaiotaomicron]|uniref:hypothetical protein n=1 Tax=Bacteroides thetaiotaomicron TaxID=818 RepID=UPI001CD1D26A
NMAETDYEWDPDQNTIENLTGTSSTSSSTPSTSTSTVYKIPLTSSGDNQLTGAQSAGTVVTSPSTGSTTILKDDGTAQT